MVYDFSFLTESGSGKSIAINPQLVRFVIEINAQTIVPPEHRRASAMNLGRTLQAVGDTRFYRLALEMRRIELALFAVRRF